MTEITALNSHGLGGGGGGGGAGISAAASGLLAGIGSE